MKLKHKGFTLIELLVVVAVIGLLTSVIMVTFSNARMKSRDTKRLSDMVQIRTGLDLYFSHGAGYPSISSWNTGNLTCDGTQIMTVPQDPQSFTYYTYNAENPITGCGAELLNKNYYVQFATEGPTELGPPGAYYMSQMGFTSAAPF